MREQWLSPDEAASLLGVNRRTILRACQNGDLPHIRFGKTIRIAGHRLEEIANTSQAAPFPARGNQSTEGRRSSVRPSLPRTGTGRTW